MYACEPAFQRVQPQRRMMWTGSQSFQSLGVLAGGIAMLTQAARGAAAVLLGEHQLLCQLNRRSISQPHHVLRERLFDEAPCVQVRARLR